MQSVLAICLGACVGALLRWRLSLWLNTGTLLPWGTLAANWIGAYVIGIVVVYFQQHPGLDPAWRLAIVTGLLGALTTFSAFSIETVALLQSQRTGLAMLNIGLNLAGSLLFTWLGLLTAQQRWPA